MGINVNGSVVLVTGANRGIGKAITEALIDAGASKVYAAVRRVESAQALIDAHGEKVVALQVDLEQPETIRAAARAAGDVRIVINNAGVLRTSSPLDADAFENLNFEMNVNVYGLMHMAQAFAPVLKHNGGGAFVQLNSVASMKTFADFTTYCASKAASYSITQGLRDKLSDQHTLVISVHPGPIATDMADDAGLGEMGEPPSVVADAVLAGLESGTFHVFPDSFAKQIGSAYAGFAESIVEANLMEG